MGLFDAVSHLGKPGKDDKPPEGASADETEELDEESGNILASLIGQLRIGMDLSKVTLPTFVLEPRSMLERITVSDLEGSGRRKRALLTSLSPCAYRTL